MIETKNQNKQRNLERAIQLTKILKNIPSLRKYILGWLILQNLF